MEPDNRARGHLLAGILYLIAGALLITSAMVAHPRKTVYIVLGALFILIGVLRIGRSRRRPPSA